MMEEIIVRDENEAIKAGAFFAKRLKPQDVVFLKGNLGSGKTTFTKGIAKGLGSTSRIISPTFVLVRTHKCHNDQGIETLYHRDLYRLENEKQVKGIDLADYLADGRGVVVVEWPDIGQNLISKKVWAVDLMMEHGDFRKLTISYE